MHQDLIRIEWVKMFNEEELQMLISGSKEGLDIADLRANTAYSGGYSDSHQVIRWLWQTLSEFDADQQASFLKVSSSLNIHASTKGVHALRVYLKLLSSY